MKNSAYPRVKFLTGLSLVTFLLSMVTLTFATPEPGAEPPELDTFQETVLASPNAQYQISPSGTQIQLSSGRLFLKPKAQITVTAHEGTVVAKSGGMFVELIPGKLTLAVMEGRAELDGKAVTAGRLAQAATAPTGDEPVLKTLGMGEGTDPVLHQLAMAEPGSVLTSLGLSEAATTSSSLLPILGGAAAAVGVGQAVSSLVQASRSDDLLAPVSP